MHHHGLFTMNGTLIICYGLHNHTDTYGAEFDLVQTLNCFKC